MQLGIRLHDVAGGTLAERLAIAREQGFVCGHLALSKVMDESGSADSALTPGYAMYLKRLFAEYGMDVAALGCYLNLATPNRQALKETQERYKAHIRFASLLGCGVVGTETGAPNEAYAFEEACHSEEALETFIRNVTPVVRYAEQMGVILAIEPVYKHIVCNSVRARKTLDAVGSPNLQIILDPVNMLDISNYKRQKEIVQEAAELLGKDVAVVHIKDYRVEGGELKSVAAGAGEMDYSGLMQFLKKEKPYIHATLEDTLPDNAEAARKHMQRLWDETEAGSNRK